MNLVGILSRFMLCNFASKACSVSGILCYDFWYNLLYLKLYHKSCKNLFFVPIWFIR